jgi:hypothetical protein
MILQAHEQPNLVNVPSYAPHVRNPTKTSLRVGKMHLRTNGEFLNVVVATNF